MRKYRKYFIVFVIIIILFIFIENAKLSNNYIDVNFLDVGQGDSIYIRTPDNYDILIDGGPDHDLTSKLNKYMPYWDRDIDWLVITHPDWDHIGGFPRVFDQYKVHNIIYTPYNHDTSVAEELLNKISKEDPIKKFIELNEDLQIGCCTSLEFFWPSESKLSKDINDSSIAFRLETYDTSIFFGGDLSKEYEDTIADKIGDVDILKVGHHGSNTSTSQYFLSVLEPEYGIISAGKDNNFGHPHLEVINNLEQYKVQILQTALEGDINLRVYKDSSYEFY
jgi:competence protein ComEC